MNVVVAAVVAAIEEAQVAGTKVIEVAVVVVEVEAEAGVDGVDTVNLVISSPMVDTPMPYGVPSPKKKSLGCTNSETNKKRKGKQQQ